MAAEPDAAGGSTAGDPFAADEARALEKLRAGHGGYDIGTIHVTDANGPLTLWVATRVEGDTESRRPLLGFTAGALEAAIIDDTRRAAS